MGNILDNIPSGEPTELVAGDTWTWRRGDLSADYPPTDYSLAYKARREGSTTDVQDIATTVVDGAYVVNVTSLTSAALVAGVWHWEAYATRTLDGARVRVGTGQWVVAPNFASAVDPRSHAVKMLAAINAVMEGRASNDVASYSIAGRSLSKLSPDELQKWRNYYRREVNSERAAEATRQGKPSGRITVARFRT